MTSHAMRKLSSELRDQERLKPACSDSEASYSLEILDIRSYRNCIMYGVNNKDADQTVQMGRLICVFVVRKCHKQLLSWCGSHNSCYLLYFSTNEPHREKTNKMAYAPSEDADQPGHPPSLIRVFTVCMTNARILSYMTNAQILSYPLSA